MTETGGFHTERLAADEWHRMARSYGYSLLDLVIGMLTPAVTAKLPAGWQGTYTRERARAWIAERDEEGATLLVIDRTSADPIGLAIVSELAGPTSDGVELRVGYLLAEAAWGQGYATELVAGIVDWNQAQPRIHLLVAGVDPSNLSSVKVLAKNGFAPVAGPTGNDDQIYQLRLPGR